MLKQCERELIQWNKSTFGNIQLNLKKAQLYLNNLIELDPLLSKPQAHQGTREVQTWLEKNELMWRKQPHIMWLKEGDQNTKYFH